MSCVVLKEPDFLRAMDPTVDTRSHRSAVPCTVDIVDKVIYTGESLNGGDITDRKKDDEDDMRSMRRRRAFRQTCDLCTHLNNLMLKA